MRSNTDISVSPVEILKYAEQLDRLPDVEKATFDNVITYIEEHPELFGNKRVFINSIPGVIIPEQYADNIRERMHRLSGKIVVELTEQAEADDKDLEEMKKRLNNLGVELAIDDYGTGYSNIYNLLRYMPNVVKIDRMLLSNIHLNAQKQHVVKEIIAFSHTNNIKVLAEGVETRDELEMVTTLGVDLVQGYYTAKPDAKVISEIDDQIRNEIVEFGQFAIHQNKRKIYEAGDTVNIPLVTLVSAHYSKIMFIKEKARDQVIKVSGLTGFQGNVDIEFGDGYSGKIELSDVDLAIRNEQPGIKIGENCDVTILLSGDNIIEQGGILVPESSKLTIEGPGNLRLKKIAINGYGIGNDKDKKCGELVFEQDGTIEIQGNIMHAVGIGAGYGGDIKINRGLYSIKLAGEDAVGIGSLHSDIKMSINSCGLEFNMRSSVNVGIGSLDGSVELDMSRVGINGFFSSSKCTCIGTHEGASCKFKLSQATGEFNAHATYMCGIGNIAGDADISMDRFSLKMTVDGDNAIAIGNLDKTASVYLDDGDMLFDVTNKIGFDIGAEKLDVIGGYNEFKLNGEMIKR